MGEFGGSREAVQVQMQVYCHSKEDSHREYVQIEWSKELSSA